MKSWGQKNISVRAVPRYKAACFEPYKNRILNYVKIEDVLLSSQYGLSIEMNEDGDGTKIYRMNEINNMFCSQNVLKFAPITNEEIKKYSLNDRDVLFNRTNSQSFVGRTGIFRNFSSEKFVFASYLIRIKPNENLVSPEYLTAFLNTKHGVLDIKRRARMSINQSNINAEELKRVEIPIVSKGFQQYVMNCFSEAFILLKESEKKYKATENILLSELGLINWQPKHQLSFVRSFSEAKEAGRMDAEYFHPSYDDIFKAIENTGLACSVQELLSVCQRGKQPVYCDEGGVVVNSKHVRNGEILIDDDNRKGVFASASVLIKKNDILMNGTGVGTIGRCAPYLHDHTAIPDNHVTVLRTKKMDSVFLAIQLDSLVGQMQVKKFQKGSSGQIELYPDDIKKL
jgi:type I restriction enzyme M protein